MTGDACFFCSQPVALSAKHCPQCGQPHILRDKYRIVGLLGRGGFGIVYEAIDVQLKRHYAIKIILSETASAQQQVQTEGEILAQYARRFPFMPEIYDIWHEGSHTTLVMEYVEGQTLGQLLGDHGAWSVAEVQEFLATVLTDLAKLHAVGIIHRDLKPDNIKRTPEGRYMLLDFGIAKQEGSTLAGAKAFSPSYASPEQMRGEPTDERSDLYSLGATAYHLLTGQAPMPSEYRRSTNTDLPQPSTFYPAIPPVSDQMIMAMLDLDPAKRPADATTALAMLQPAQAVVAAPPAVVAKKVVPAPEVVAYTQPTILQVPEQPRLRSRMLVWPGVALLALLLAGGGWWLLRKPQPSPAPTPAPVAAETVTPVQAVLSAAQAGMVRQQASFGRGYLTDVALSPDDTTLAIGTSLGVELWNTATQQQTALISGFETPVDSLAWHPDGRLAVVGGQNVRVFNATGALQTEWAGPGGSSIDAVVWSPDGQYLLGSAYSRLLLWNAEGILTTIPAHDDGIVAVAWTADSQRFASVSQDETARVWNADGTLITTILDHRTGREGQRNWVQTVAWRPDGQRLATGSYDGEIRVWNAADASSMLLPTPAESGAVLALAWSPDGRTLASSASDSVVQLWRDAQSTKQLTGHSDNITNLAWSADGDRLLTGSADGTLRLWRNNGEFIRAFDGASGAIKRLVWGDNGQTIIATTDSEEIRAWNVDGTPLEMPENYTSPVQTVVWSPDGRTVAVDAMTWDVLLWQPDDNATRLLAGYTNPIAAVAWSADGTTIAASAFDGQTRLWQPDGTSLRTLQTAGVVESLAWNAAGDLAGGANDGVVHVLPKNGDTMINLSAGSAAVRVLAWQPDGLQLAVGYDDGSLRLWDVASATSTPLNGHTERITALAWNADGSKLVSASADQTARLWNADGSAITSLQAAETGAVNAVAWSFDGATLATGTANGAIRLWDANGTAKNTISQHTAEIRALAWNSAGVLASASADTTARLWDTNGNALATLVGHTAVVQTVAWSPDGSRLVTGSDDGTIRVWGRGK